MFVHNNTNNLTRNMKQQQQIYSCNDDDHASHYKLKKMKRAKNRYNYSMVEFFICSSFAEVK